MSEWNQQQQQPPRQQAISFATPPNPRTDSSRGPFADPPPSQGNNPYLGVPTSEYTGSSSTLSVHEFGFDNGNHYDEEAQPLTQGAPGGFGGGFYPPPG